MGEKLCRKEVKNKGKQVYCGVFAKLDILTDFVDVHAEPQQNAQACIT